MITFSRTVSSLSSVSSCGTTPRRARIFGPSRAGSRPRMLSVPAVTGETQPIIRIVELLPAPFGPRKPNASPFCTSKSIASTAVSAPNVLTSPRAWISGASALMCGTLPTALELFGCALERFCDLGEVVLVGKSELDARCADLRVVPGDVLERDAHARGERRVD